MEYHMQIRKEHDMNCLRVYIPNVLTTVRPDTLHIDVAGIATLSIGVNEMLVHRSLGQAQLTTRLFNCHSLYVLASLKLPPFVYCGAKPKVFQKKMLTLAQGLVSRILYLYTNVFF